MAGRRVDRHHTIHLNGPIARAFPMFTPLGEEAWVPGWSPDYIHPEDGRTSAGMVFQTGTGADATIWACAEWDPAGHRARYVRVTPASRIAEVVVRCRPLPLERTQADVTYAVTALNADGEAYLADFTETAYAAMIEEWRVDIDRWLADHPGAVVRH
ncbi:hypothetical protein [Consotaella aegiceratis]|uniref:hypothetical protein n=1 Tax=Consotaella aegiceratis TaxID=3097961 RepID=UPI002F420493